MMKSPPKVLTGMPLQDFASYLHYGFETVVAYQQVYSSILSFNYVVIC